MGVETTLEAAPGPLGVHGFPKEASESCWRAQASWALEKLAFSSNYVVSPQKSVAVPGLAQKTQELLVKEIPNLSNRQHLAAASGLHGAQAGGEPQGRKTGCYSLVHK